ncbi:MAG: thioesterase family protein [Gammaproteobacteria bacterium]|nr:thioesterase family protein [Gammaproteobacteria bacterium]
MKLFQPFHYTLEVQQSHINDGDHLSFISLVVLLGDIRKKTLNALGLTEKSLDGNNTGLILVNTEAKIRNQCLLGDKLLVEVSIVFEHEYFCSFEYKVKNMHINKTASLVKDKYCYYNYDERKTTKVPEGFKKAVLDTHKESGSSINHNSSHLA